ncbi:MAG: SsrA-binding protein [Patescibacteria group bacterium]|nr:MAG: SsrA-binding protein [Patescibacteria group bacterium]
MIKNRLGYRNYTPVKEFTAGIALTGPEVKSVREGRLQLEKSFVRFIQGELYLVGAVIHPYKYADSNEFDPERSRKLLLTKKEIIYLKSALEKNRSLTIIPLICYNKSKYIKLKIALARGKRKFDIKSVEKQKQIKHDQEKEIKEVFKRG